MPNKDTYIHTSLGGTTEVWRVMILRVMVLTTRCTSHTCHRVGLQCTWVASYTGETSDKLARLSYK